MERLRIRSAQKRQGIFYWIQGQAVAIHKGRDRVVYTHPSATRLSPLKLEVWCEGGLHMEGVNKWRFKVHSLARWKWYARWFMAHFSVTRTQTHLPIFTPFMMGAKKRRLSLLLLHLLILKFICGVLKTPGDGLKKGRGGGFVDFDLGGTYGLSMRVGSLFVWPGCQNSDAKNLFAKDGTSLAVLRMGRLNWVCTTDVEVLAVKELLV